MPNSDGKKRRVCVVCEQWGSGGIESFLYNTFLHMDLSELEIDLVAAELRESIFTETLQSRGIRFVELSGSRYRACLNYRQFKKLLLHRPYEVIHVNAYHAMSMYYCKLALLAGIPRRIVHSHNTALRKSPFTWIKLLLHSYCRNRYSKCATDYWACSRLAADFMFSAEQIGDPGRCCLIPNGIDSQRFRFQNEKREKIRIDLGLDGKIVFGNVGRFSEQKNQAFLLEIMKELVERVPNARLMLVGDGEMRGHLIQLAVKYGIMDRVLFVGTSDHVEAYLWAMDVFVFPSRFEGFGIAAIEAQAAGLPVLCSDRVPAEARLLETVRCLPLESGAAAWAREAASMSMDEPQCRERFAGAVAAKGYDVSETANLMRKAYCGREE